METARVVLERAAAFRARHEGEPGVGDTFGYFTRHPVAPLNQRRLDTILSELAKAGRPLRVLDLACGGGLISCAVSAAGHRVLGLDLNASEIRLAQSFATEGGFTAQFRRADLLAEPDWEREAAKSLDGPPDVILLAYALHHLPGVEAFIPRLAGALAPGAFLLINEENPDSPLFRLKHVVRTWIQKDTETEWHRRYAGWRALLEQNGLRVGDPIGLDPVPGWGSLLPRLSWSLVFTARKD